MQEVRLSEEQSEREGEKLPSILHQWDATSLITCAKFQLDGRLILDYVLDVAHFVITREVQQETVEAGLAGGYPDAMVVKGGIDAGRIEVRTVAQMSARFEEILDLQLLLAIRPRLQRGFVEHSLARIEGVR